MEITINEAFLTLFLLIIAYVIFSVIRIAVKSSQKGKKILCLGLSGSGKTAFLARCFTDTPASSLKTVPSMRPNELALMKCRIFSPAQRENLGSLLFVDIPGHVRLRNGYEQHLKQSRSILLFVDSSDDVFASQASEIADYMYRILTEKTVTGRRLSLTVVCNKQDLGDMALDKQDILDKLEREINILRDTRAKAISLQDDAKKKTNIQDQQYLGAKGTEFKFDQLTNNKVRFVKWSSLYNPSMSAFDYKTVVNDLIK